ncbi:MAG: hypothetical protein GVY16_05625 [Planctomycetes bacterium]|jgi:hypothetical protein|nr:hypothetical protein [Phycisphaerae bacterium]NBB95202.1 hypothetical protein [Planctomycetota bacterium]
MARAEPNSGDEQTDRVDLAEETAEAGRRNLLQRDPLSETDVIAADQFVRPGEHEFPPEPPPEPRPAAGAAHRDTPLRSTLRTVALAGIAIVLMLCVFAAIYLMRPSAAAG